MFCDINFIYYFIYLLLLTCAGKACVEVGVEVPIRWIQFLVFDTTKPAGCLLHLSAIECRQILLLLVYLWANYVDIHIFDSIEVYILQNID
jgi:hypothetical protein